MKALIQSACLALGLAVALSIPGSSAALAENGANQPATGHTFAVDRWTEKEQKIVDALNRPLKDPLDFDGDALSEVINTIAETYQFPIVPDVRSLDAAQINLDEEQVWMELSDVTLRSALNLILEQYELAYVIEDEVLQILWDEDVDNHLTTVIYDVRPLIDAGYREIDFLTLIMNETSGPWFPDDPSKRIENVIGGLAARQTQPMHDEIEALLQDLLKLSQRPSRRQPQNQPHDAGESEPAEGQAEGPAGENAPRADTDARKPSNTSASAVFHPAQMTTIIYDVGDLTDAGMSASHIARVMPIVLTEILWDDDTLTADRDDGSRERMVELPEGCRWTMPVTMGPPLGWASWFRSISGRVEPVGKRLAVVQTPKGHEDVRRLLTALRAAVAAGVDGGVTAHPLQPWNAYPGPVGNTIFANPPWQVVVYNLAPLTEIGETPERLSRAVRKTVRPNNWGSIPLPSPLQARLPSHMWFHPIENVERQGRIEPLGKTLVVYQARFVHESIEAFLHDLHRTHQAPAAEGDETPAK